MKYDMMLASLKGPDHDAIVITVDHWKIRNTAKTAAIREYPVLPDAAEYIVTGPAERASFAVPLNIYPIWNTEAEKQGDLKALL
jgi:hypothetical protein